MAVVFMATISMLQSAIQIAGDGGARIKLDVDDSGMDAIMALSALRGELLRVTVEACTTGPEQGNGKERDNMETRAKRKSRWESAEAARSGDTAAEGGQPDSRSS